MSNCKKCKKKDCGCKDQGLTTPQPCPADQINCPTPEPCSETFSDCCVIHDGDSITEFNIEKGDSMCVILQKIILNVTAPGCVNPTLGCQSPLGVHSTATTPNSISIAWNLVGGTPTGLFVESRPTGTVLWAIGPTLPDTDITFVIPGLQPNTEYDIRVGTGCGCYSVTIRVKTNKI